MKAIFMVFFLLAGNAQADLLLGVFEGKTATGEACKIQVNSKYYFPDQKHPLNERVSVTVEGLNWDLAHPPSLNIDAGAVSFDHNIFQQIVPIENAVQASEALVMKIDHDLDPHPATEYTYIAYYPRDASMSKKLTCLGLKKQ